MTHLVLVRHGETAWNHDRRLQGQIDVALSDFGRAQAARLRDRLRREPFAAAYSSDLSRCWETATTVLVGRDVPLRPMVGLREVHLGAWQGRSWDELRAVDPAAVAWVEADLANRAPPGGETRRELQARVVRAIEEIAAAHPDDQVLVVSHGGALRAFLCWVLDADLLASRRIELDNTGVCRVHLRGDSRMLVAWNDVSHLAGLVDPAAGGPRAE
jgi:probable phosphoglycerate mutase